MLAAAYDRYAQPLFSYCSTILPQPADAADALQDTFVIAAARLTSLRNPDCLRAWLYAVARNECIRRLHPKEIPVPEVPETPVDPGFHLLTEHAELRALVTAAADGMNPAEREVLCLQYQQGLNAPETAQVLHIKPNHVHALLSRARDEFLTSLGVLLVARTGRQACADLDRLLKGWDGRLTILLRKRLVRHVARCAECDVRRQQELRPAMLLGVPALAALPAAAAMLPAGLRAQVLGMATSAAGPAQAHRAAVAARAGGFTRHGFPHPLHRLHLVKALLAAHPVHTAAAATAGTVASAAAAAVVVTGGGAAAHLHFPGLGVTNPTPNTAAPARPGRRDRSPAAPLPAAAVPPQEGTQTATPVTVRSPAAHSSSPGPPAPSPAPSASSTATPTTTPTPTQTQTPVVQATGTLSVSPLSLTLSLLPGSNLTLTANGGPVSWSITEPAPLLGKVTVSPSSGILQAGQQVTVTVTVTGIASLNSDLLVNPGGQVVTILLGLL